MIGFVLSTAIFLILAAYLAHQFDEMERYRLTNNFVGVDRGGMTNGTMSLEQLGLKLAMTKYNDGNYGSVDKSLVTMKAYLVQTGYD